MGKGDGGPRVGDYSRFEEESRGIREWAEKKLAEINADLANLRADLKDEEAHLAELMQEQSTLTDEMDEQVNDGMIHVSQEEISSIKAQILALEREHDIMTFVIERIALHQSKFDKALEDPQSSTVH